MSVSAIGLPPCPSENPCRAVADDELGAAETGACLRASSDPESFARAISHLRRCLFASLRIDVLPQLRNLSRRAARWRRLHDRSAIDHRGSIIGPLMEDDGRDAPVFRRAATASAVILARGAAPFTTNRMGFPAPLAIATVAATARRDHGALLE